MGYALGLGMSYALTDHWIVKADMMRMSFAGGRTEGYVNLTCFPGISSGVCNPASSSYW